MLAQKNQNLDTKYVEQKLDYNSDIVHFLFTLFWISRIFDGPLLAEKKRGKFKIV